MFDAMRTPWITLLLPAVLQAADPVARSTSFAVERALAPAFAALESRCTLAPDALAARKPVVRNLLGEARATRKLADGVALEFDRNPAMRKRIEDFVAFERGCCGHLTFAVRDRRRDRKIDLAVTSPDPQVRSAIWQRLERR